LGRFLAKNFLQKRNGIVEGFAGVLYGLPAAWGLRRLFQLSQGLSIMSKLRISSLLFALLTGFSVAATAVEAPATPQPVAAQAPVVAPVAKVNLNSADAQTLARELNGIGEAKARAIVEYREAKGSFSTVDELLEVKGIGSATLEKNRERLTVN
jgi:competence protein ComEA